MADESKLFLKHLANSWKSEFPFLKPADLDEIPRVPKGCNFLCDAYGKTRGVYYFFAVEFSPKRGGEFSLRIAISPSQKRSTLDHFAAPRPSPTSTGSFGIARFLEKQRSVWALADLEAERDALFAQLGVSMPDLGAHRGDTIWRPTTYKQSFAKIAGEAIVNLNLILRTKVFPVLQIDVEGLSSVGPP